MRRVLNLLLALPLAACGQAAPQPEPSAKDQAAPTAQLAPRVRALLPDEVAQADLGGELGCSFTEGTRPAPLLVATGMVDDPEGTAQAIGGGDGAPLRLEAVERGGFDAMLNGAEFAGKGFAYRVHLTGADAAGAGGESPARPATLTVTAPWGKRAVLQGRWTCGP